MREHRRGGQASGASRRQGPGSGTVGSSLASPLGSVPRVKAPHQRALASGSLVLLLQRVEVPGPQKHTPATDFRLARRPLMGGVDYDLGDHVRGRPCRTGPGNASTQGPKMGHGGLEKGTFLFPPAEIGNDFVPSARKRVQKRSLEGSKRPKKGHPNPELPGPAPNGNVPKIRPGINCSVS